MSRKPMREVVGYEGIGPNRGKFVEADNALEYALAQCGISIVDSFAPDCEEFTEEFETWYFSDNWVEVYENGEE